MRNKQARKLELNVRFKDVVAAMLDCASAFRNVVVSNNAGQGVIYKNNNSKATLQAKVGEPEVFVLRKESSMKRARAIPLTELEHKDIPKRHPL
jgi:hypothetical protein